MICMPMPAIRHALEIFLRWAAGSLAGPAQFTTEQFDNILDHETGGMLEVWANLYGVTGEKRTL